MRLSGTQSQVGVLDDRNHGTREFLSGLVFSRIWSPHMIGFGVSVRLERNGATPDIHVAGVTKLMSTG